MNKTTIQSATIADTPGSFARINLLTVIAIAICSYLLGTIIHEVLGHGLAALILGLHPTRVTSVDLEVSFTGADPWRARAVDAAGCAGNLVGALIAMGLLRTLRHANTNARYFLWLLATINLFIVGGYLVFPTLLGFGDWISFTKGLEPLALWRIGLIVLGCGVLILALWWSVRAIDPFLGQGVRNRHRRANQLATIAYLAGSIISTLAGMFNPTSPQLILISAAAASFGGTCFLVFLNVFIGKSSPATPATPLTPTRSLPWLVLGAFALLVYFVVLGPGLPR
ncbi:hypothetical protein [Ktedonobacter racemifer]|uniref:Uncharacterized protein n=1 Tax=Ktedonobacter racemifer DSM 44963 TaxID=485913 RepID=D6TIF8_KTERA|nr:hypothetical protein [Ktedonobacter racemifer]EFH89215.1 conserved hypothetical protein [Ktedonobacter racemifer DSM 44963]